MNNELMSLHTKDSDDLIKDIKSLITEARKLTYQSANSLMLRTYWLIGQRIANENTHYEQTALQNNSVLKALSKSLTEEFGNGFSYSNLSNMRRFYTTYPDWESCYEMCGKLSWSHNRLIMRVSDVRAREYYLREAAAQQWTVRQTEREINTFGYHRLLSAIEDPAQCSQHVEEINVKNFIRDPYVLEFMGLPALPDYKEKGLEKALLLHMRDFLLELGKGFSFVKSQYRISTETSHFYIDLVFYNYILKCFVLIDLKTDKLSHQDVGQMDMYIRMFDDLKRGEDDNPTIGILMCAEKEETVVKYSVLNGSEQIFASKYLPYLPTELELRNELERRERYLKSGSEE